MNALREEFKDRFGPVPEQVENLLYQLKIKLRAEEIGLASITNEGEQIVLRYPQKYNGNHEMKEIELFLKNLGLFESG